MKLDGDEYKDLRDKYFNQTADDFKNFLGTTRLAKYFLRCRLMDAKRLAIKGKAAPDFEVYDVEAKKANFLDFERISCFENESRPLVVNFGSCS